VPRGGRLDLLAALRPGPVGHDGAAPGGLVKWRTGCEGRISCLKRDFGWSRTRIDGIDGARTWCGHGVFNHNLIKIAALTSQTA